MKIYAANRHHKLDDFIGTNYWVLCKVQLYSDIWDNYLVKILSEHNNSLGYKWYSCDILHQSNLNCRDNEMLTEYEQRTKSVRHRHLCDDQIKLITPIDCYTSEELFGENSQ